MSLDHTLSVSRLPDHWTEEPNVQVNCPVSYVVLYHAGYLHIWSFSSAKTINKETLCCKCTVEIKSYHYGQKGVGMCEVPDPQISESVDKWPAFTSSCTLFIWSHCHACVFSNHQVSLARTLWPVFQRQATSVCIFIAKSGMDCPKRGASRKMYMLWS